ncbi:MAG TPA: MFS transporter [Kineosporiaceae bacterium]|nr:MFS transporter [Kineosporiaceae bacterium]
MNGPSASLGSRHAWLVWSVAMTAYVVAVLNRTSFGVAGLLAAQRFGVSASLLAGFTVLQLLVYAGLQIPVGMMLDRFGPRRLVATGAVVMACGQFVLALTQDLGPAYAGRALVGAGDAMTFISVLRLVAAWFPPRRVPLLSQVTGLVGQLGQVLSAVPLVALLHGPGWTPAFLGIAAVGLLVGTLALAVVRDSPAGHAPAAVRAGRGVVADLVSAWQHPGTRLGLWTHFTTQFPGTVFALMWGFPFLVSGEGVTSATAGAFLTGFVLVGMVAGPVLGVLVERHPLRRSWLVLGVVAANAAAWTLVIAWPGRAPLPVLTVLVVALAVGGPGSMIGFDFARTFNPPNRLGTATGIVNVGGFIASLVAILLVGVLLDARSGGRSGYALADFRVAMSVQYLVWAVGVGGILRSRRRVRARMAEQGVVVPPIREVLARRRVRRAG